jgi:hypothetical protein
MTTMSGYTIETDGYAPRFGAWTGAVRLVAPDGRRVCHREVETAAERDRAVSDYVTWIVGDGARP